MHVEELRLEYESARRYTLSLYDDLDEADAFWRPSERGSGIAWHLGHQAAVNHYLVRNLVAAEASPRPSFDPVFDSATQEVDRGALPSLAEIVAYREAVAARTAARVEEVLRGEVGAPAQLREVVRAVLVGLVNHEYQHDRWIGEVRAHLGYAPPERPRSPHLVDVEGYLVVDPMATVPGAPTRP